MAVCFQKGSACVLLTARRCAGQRRRVQHIYDIFGMDDEWNVTQSQPDVFDEFKNEIKDVGDQNEQSCNISRLPSHLRCRMQSLSKTNFPAMNENEQKSLGYKRSLFGRFGKISGMDPSICWPSKRTVAFESEKESQFSPDLHEMIQISETKKMDEERKIKDRMDLIAEKLKHAPEEIKKYEKTLKNRELNVRKAEEKRRALVEEVRDHYGYSLRSNDDKFKQYVFNKHEAETMDKKAAKKKASQSK